MFINTAMASIPSTEQIINDVAKTLLSRQNMVQAGRYLAEGFQGAGTSSGFQPSNPTGVAGGRRSEQDSLIDPSIKRESERAWKQQTQSMETEAKLRKALNNQYADHTTLVKNLSGSLSSMGPAVQGFERNITSVGSVVSDRLQHLSDSFTDHEKEVKFWTKVRKKTGVDLQQLEAKRARILKMLVEGSGRHELVLKDKLKSVEQERLQVLDTANDLQQEQNRSLLQNISATASFTYALNAVRSFAEDVNAQLKYGNIGGIAEQQKFAVLLGGVDPAALSEMSAQARQATVAMGGQTKMFNAMLERQYDLYKVTGDFAEAARHSTEMLQMIGKAGIRPSIQEFDALTSQFNYFHKMVGMTTEQYRQMFQQLTENSDVRYRLQALDEEQRRRQIEGIMLRTKENVAMGMTIEQAQKAAEALAAMTGAGPKERFKQAAQLQMAAGMMGIRGGAEAAQILRRGERADPDERLKLESFMKRVADERVKTRVGALGSEFAVDALMQQTGLEGVVGKDSPFITTLTEAFKPEGEVTKNIKTTAQSASVIEKGVLATVQGLTVLTGVVRESAVGGIASGLAGGVGTLFGGKLLRGAARGVKGLFGAGAAAGGAGAGAAAGGAAGRGILARGAGAVKGLFGRGAATRGAGMGARALAAGGGTAAAGGMAGLLASWYGGKLAGKGIDKIAEVTTGKKISDRESTKHVVGTTVDTVLSWFGSDAAKRRMELNRVAQDENYLDFSSQDKKAADSEKVVRSSEETAKSTQKAADRLKNLEELQRLQVEMAADEISSGKAMKRIQELQNGQSATTVDS